MNRIHPKKLLNSKWTAVNPARQEKHFLITEVEFNEDGEVVHCLIEAVLTRRETSMDWRDLKDDSKWLTGWK